MFQDMFHKRKPGEYSHSIGWNQSISFPTSNQLKPLIVFSVDWLIAFFLQWQTIIFMTFEHKTIKLIEHRAVSRA